MIVLFCFGVGISTLLVSLGHPKYVRFLYKHYWFPYSSKFFLIESLTSCRLVNYTFCGHYQMLIYWLYLLWKCYCLCYDYMKWLNLFRFLVLYHDYILYNSMHWVVCSLSVIAPKHFYPYVYCLFTLWILGDLGNCTQNYKNFIVL